MRNYSYKSKIKSLFIWQVMCIFTLFLSVFNTAAYADTISIGVFNQHITDEDILFWNKTADYLTDHIDGHKFVIKPMGRECLDNAVDKNQLHFIITSPNHLVQLVANGAKLIATLQTEYLKNPHDYFAATVITKANNSAINTLSSLKNQSIAATSPFEFGGFQIMQREFMLSGITPDRDFFELRFTNGSQKNIVHAVLTGGADAGIIRSGLLENMIQNGELQKNKIKIVLVFLRNFVLMTKQKVERQMPSFPKEKRVSFGVMREIVVFVVD